MAATLVDKRQALRSACTAFVGGRPRQLPGQEMIEIGEWCKSHGYEADQGVNMVADAHRRLLEGARGFDHAARSDA